MPADVLPRGDVLPRDVTRHHVSTRSGFRASLLLVGITGVVGLFVWGLFVGQGDVTTDEIWRVLGADDRSPAAVIVWDMRITRMLTAVIAGAALGVAGTVMQSMVQNPLADPGILGVNAGAGLAVVLVAGAGGAVAFGGTLLAAFVGAAVVSVIVFAIGFASKRLAPATLVLAGTAITAVLLGVSTGLALLDPTRFSTLRGWMAGSTTGRTMEEIALAGGVIAAGVLLSLVFSGSISQLALGADTAHALGVPVMATRIAAAVAVLLLAGSATALAGPIVFIGLMVPHLVRALIGAAGSWGMLLAIVAGALLLLAADIIGRVVIAPAEAPAGVITAIAGAPVLALVARGRREDA